MPSIINASTSNGLIQTADTSGVLQLQSNGSTVATAQSTGFQINTYSSATSLLTVGTALTPTSGTSVSFTSIPSWVRRITVLFNGLTASASNPLIQIGAGSTTITGYTSTSLNINNTISGSGANSTAGFNMNQTFSTGLIGSMTISNINGNNWISNHSAFDVGGGRGIFGNGVVALGGTLDRVIITSVSGLATFSAGTVNIFYE